MTLHEIDCDVLSRMPQQNRLPVLTDHENAEMYKLVNQAVREYRDRNPNQQFRPHNPPPPTP